MTIPTLEKSVAEMTAAEFLTEVYGRADCGNVCVCKSGPANADGSRSALQTIGFYAPHQTEEMAAAVEKHSQSSCVYFGVGLIDEGITTGRGGGKEFTIGLPGYWVDIDFKDPVHKKLNLPADVNEARALLNDIPLKPTIVWMTGHGLQALFLFHDIQPSDGDIDKENAIAMHNGFKRMVKSFAKARGWEVDSVADLARVLRPVGSTNRKSDPVRVKCLEFNPDNRYDPMDFESFFPPAPAKKEASPSGIKAPTNRAKLDIFVIEEKVRRKPKYDALYRGNHSAHASQSEADLSLCNRIAFFCGNDVSLVDQVFRRSGLMRDKWDEKRGESTYGRDTAIRAITGCQRYYDWDKKAVESVPQISAEAVSNGIKGTTDISNSERFVEQHGQVLRYCHQRGAWLFWNGKRWRWDESGRALAAAKRTATKILDEAKAEANEAAKAKDEASQQKHAQQAQMLAKWGIASQKRERILAMMDLAKPDLSIATDQLDADESLLNCPNGTVDTRNGQMRDHSPADYITKMCRANFKPNAPSPLFIKCLGRIFRTHPQVIAYVQAAIGYSATSSPLDSPPTNGTTS